MFAPSVCCETSLPSSQAFDEAAAAIRLMGGRLSQGQSDMIATDAQYLAHLSTENGSGGFAVGLPNDGPERTRILLYIFPDMFRKKKAHAWLKEVSTRLCRDLPDGDSSYASYTLLQFID